MNGGPTHVHVWGWGEVKGEKGKGQVYREGREREGEG